ncbi:hypothetical protein ANRL4_03707 [Anaerolineae bacterium]|nr:hypothetical protein ANRL4_03707 [Anaerolineae bacterium]
MATWNFDSSHSGASFSVRHMMITTVRGGFDQVSGSLEFDLNNPANSSVEAHIAAASISTGNEQRDAHLRSADFLNADEYPTLHFKSTKVVMTGENTAKIHGDLNIRGKALPVVLEAEYLGENTSPYGDQRIGFIANTKINREDWGLTWNVPLAQGGVLVGKEISISLDIQAVLVTEKSMA